MYCWAQCPMVVLVSLGVTLDSAETAFAKNTLFLVPDEGRLLPNMFDNLWLQFSDAEMSKKRRTSSAAVFENHQSFTFGVWFMLFLGPSF